MEIQTNGTVAELRKGSVFKPFRTSKEKYIVEKVIMERYSDTGRKCVYVRSAVEGESFEGTYTRHQDYPIYILTLGDSRTTPCSVHAETAYGRTETLSFAIKCF